MAIVDNKKLRFVKKGFPTISDAKSYATNGRVVFDSTHKVVCVDQQVYGGSTYKGTAMNHDQLVAFLKDPNNMPGYMYSIGFANEDNVTGGNWVDHSVDPATHQEGTYDIGPKPTQTQGAVVDNDAEATGEYNTSYGVQQPDPNKNKGAIYGDDVDTPNVHEGLRNQIVITITSKEADAISAATGARINPNKFESGDLFIFTGSTWVVITGEDQVIDDVNLWSWEGTSPDQSGLVRPVLRDVQATQVSDFFYPKGQDDKAMNQAIVNAPIGKVDGIDLNLKLKNPTLTDGDLVAYNTVTIGNLTIPKGFKIPAGVFMEDILRAMITTRIYPSAPTEPSFSKTAGSDTTGTVVIKDQWQPASIGHKITKGKYDKDNWTDGSNANLPLATAVARAISYSNAVTNATGGAFNGGTQPQNQNGKASDNDWIQDASFDVATAGTTVGANASKVKTTISWNYSTPAAGADAFCNDGTATRLKGKSPEEKNIGVSRADWANSSGTSTVTQQRDVIYPIWFNFVPSQAVGNGNDGKGGKLSRTAASGGVFSTPNGARAPFTHPASYDGTSIETYRKSGNNDGEFPACNLNSATQQTIHFDIAGGPTPILWVPRWGQDDSIQISIGGTQTSASGATAQVENSNWKRTATTVTWQDATYNYWAIELFAATGGFCHVTLPHNLATAIS